MMLTTYSYKPRHHGPGNLEEQRLPQAKGQRQNGRSERRDMLKKGYQPRHHSPGEPLSLPFFQRKAYEVGLKGRKGHDNQQGYQP